MLERRRRNNSHPASANATAPPSSPRMNVIFHVDCADGDAGVGAGSVAASDSVGPTTGSAATGSAVPTCGPDPVEPVDDEALAGAWASSRRTASGEALVRGCVSPSDTVRRGGGGVTVGAGWVAGAACGPGEGCGGSSRKSRNSGGVSGTASCAPAGTDAASNNDKATKICPALCRYIATSLTFPFLRTVIASRTEPAMNRRA